MTSTPTGTSKPIITITTTRPFRKLLLLLIIILGLLILMMMIIPLQLIPSLATATSRERMNCSLFEMNHRQLADNPRGITLTATTNKTQTKADRESYLLSEMYSAGSLMRSLGRYWEHRKIVSNSS